MALTLFVLVVSLIQFCIWVWIGLCVGIPHSQQPSALQVRCTHILMRLCVVRHAASTQIYKDAWDRLRRQGKAWPACT